MNSPTQPKISLITRLASMLLDHAVMGFISGIIIAPAIMMTIFQGFNSNEPPIMNGIDPLILYLFPLAFAVYFAKDSIDGRSIAKRALKLQVVTIRTGETAGPIRCCIRNLLIVIWPLEVFFTLFSTSRRLGDLLAGTRIVTYSGNKEKASIQWSNIIAALLIGYFFAFLVVNAMNIYLFKPMEK